MAIVGSLEIQIRASMDQFAAQMQKVTAQLDRLAGQFDKVQKAGPSAAGGIDKATQSADKLAKSSQAAQASMAALGKRSGGAVAGAGFAAGTRDAAAFSRETLKLQAVLGKTKLALNDASNAAGAAGGGFGKAGAGLKQAGDAAGRAGDGLRKAGESARQAGGGFSKAQVELISTAAAANLAVGAFRLLRTAFGGAVGALVEGDKFNNIARGFDAMQTKAGVLGSIQLPRLRAAVQGTASDLNLMQQANYAVSLGLDATKLDQMAAAATKLGAALGRDANEAFNDLALGLGRGSRLILDNLGIIVDTEQAYLKFAKANGVAANELNDFGKKLAFQEEGMRLIAEKAADLTPLILDNGRAFKIAAASFANFQTGITSAISGNKDLTKGLEKLSKEIKDLDPTVVVKFFNYFAEGAINVLSEVGNLIRGLERLKSALPDFLGFTNTLQAQGDRAALEVERRRTIRAGAGPVGDFVERGVFGELRSERKLKEAEQKFKAIRSQIENQKFLDSFDEKALLTTELYTPFIPTTPKKYDKADITKLGDEADKSASKFNRLQEAIAKVNAEVAEIEAEVVAEGNLAQLEAAVAIGDLGEIERLGQMYKENIRQGIIDGYVEGNKDAGEAVARAAGEKIADAEIRLEESEAKREAEGELREFNQGKLKEDAQRAFELALEEGNFSQLGNLDTKINEITEQEVAAATAAGMKDGFGAGIAANTALIRAQAQQDAEERGRAIAEKLKEAHGKAVEFWSETFTSAIDGVELDFAAMFKRLAIAFASELAGSLTQSLFGGAGDFSAEGIGKLIGQEFIKAAKGQLGSYFGFGSGTGTSGIGGVVGQGGSILGGAETDIYGQIVNYGASAAQQYAIQQGAAYLGGGAATAAPAAPVIVEAGGTAVVSGSGAAAAGTTGTTGAAAAGGSSYAATAAAVAPYAAAAAYTAYIGYQNYDRISSWSAETSDTDKAIDAAILALDVAFLGMGTVLDKIFDFDSRVGGNVDPNEIGRRQTERALEGRLAEREEETGRKTQFFNAQGQLEDFSGNLEFGKYEEQLEGFGERFAAMGDEVFTVFHSLGDVFAMLFTEVDDLGGQIGYILAENLNGNIDNARLLVQGLGLEFGDVEQAMYDAAIAGDISWGKFIATLDGIAPAFGEGLVAVGDLAGAWNQLIASGGTGVAALTGLENIITEAGESGAASFGELKDKMVAAGVAAEDVDKLFAAMADRGVNLSGSLDQLKGLSDVQLGAIVGQAQNFNLAFDELPENLKESEVGVKALTHQVENLTKTIASVPKEIRIKSVFEGGDEPDTETKTTKTTTTTTSGTSGTSGGDQGKKTSLASRLTKGKSDDEDDKKGRANPGVTGSQGDTRITPGGNITTTTTTTTGGSKSKGGSSKKKEDPAKAVIDELLKSIDPILDDIAESLAAAVDVASGVGKELTDLFAQREALGELAFGNAIKALARSYGAAGQERLFSRALKQIAEQVKRTHDETVKAAQDVAEALGPLQNADKTFNLLGNIDGLRSAIGELELDFDKAAGTIVDAARKGTISWGEFLDQLTKTEAAFAPGLEAAGHITGAFNNLIVSGGKGFDAIQAIRDLAVEGLEAGATTIDELAVKLKAFGIFDPAQIDELIGAMKTAGFGSATGGDLQDSIVASESAFKDRAEFLNVLGAAKELGTGALGPDTFERLKGTLGDTVDPKSLGALREIISQLMTASLESLANAPDTEIGRIVGGLDNRNIFGFAQTAPSPGPAAAPIVPAVAAPVGAVDAEEQRLIDRVGSAKTAYETKRRTAELAAYRAKKAKGFALGGAFEAGRLIPVPELFTFNGGQSGVRGEAGTEVTLPLVRRGGIIGVGSVADGGGGSGVNISIDARGAAPGVEHAIERVLTRFTDVAASKALRASADHARRGGSYRKAMGR